MNNTNVRVWKTIDGRLLNINEMETGHIKNCIKMLEKYGFVRASTWAFYLTCEGPSGEHTQDAFEREADSILEKIPFDRLDYFYEELNSRGEKYE